MGLTLDQLYTSLARNFASYAHRNQLRKYVGTSYDSHLAEVAGIVATAHPSFLTPRTTAVAWLHDVMEDCEVPRHLLLQLFDDQVAEAVMQLSDLEPGNRAQRMELSRKRLTAAPPWVQTIKYADLISNTQSIVKFDPKFAAVYLQEKRELLKVMVRGCPGLRARALELANQPVPEWIDDPKTNQR